MELNQTIRKNVKSIMQRWLAEKREIADADDAVEAEVAAGKEESDLKSQGENLN